MTRADRPEPRADLLGRAGRGAGGHARGGRATAGTPIRATWDAVARELAARVAERPVEEPTRPAPERPPAEEPPSRAGRTRRRADVPAGRAGAGGGAGRSRRRAARRRTELRGGLEALLFVMDDPVDEETLAAALRCPVEQVRAGLAELAADYDERRAGHRRCAGWGRGGGSTPARSTPPVVERYLVDGPAQPAHPGGAGDPRRHRLPAAGDPGAGVGDPRRRGGRRDAHAARRAGWCTRSAPTRTAAAGCTRRRRCSWSGWA